MKHIFALALLAAIATLPGCATWRPEADQRYYCINTDVYFTVRYNWSPPPSARLQLDGGEAMDLPLVAEEPGSYGGHYIYEARGLRLAVTPDYALLDRPGERRQSCRRETPIIV